VPEPTSPPATDRSAWRWLPSLYFAEGIPYVVVMTVAVVMYKRLGVSNKDLAFYTSWLYLPWVIKPLWSPLVEATSTRRGWIVLTQLLIGAGLASTALAIPSDEFLGYTLAAFTFLAFSSATHDVAADGFYMLGLNDHQQAWFVGIRSTCYRLAMIAGQGLLVMLAGWLESTSGLPPVRLKVEALADPPAMTAFSPGDPGRAFETVADAARESAAGDPQRIEVAKVQTVLGLGPRDPATIDAQIAAVRQWNIRQGFYQAVETPSGTRDASVRSWWSHGVAWMETLLRRWFGPEGSASAGAVRRSGDVAVIVMRLAYPDRTVDRQVVQVGRSGGDKSFEVVEGDRFEVTAANADQPFVAVIQVDPKLQRSSSAEFEIRSGNLPYAWATTFYLLAGFFLLLALYHGVVLPRPATDRPGAGLSAGWTSFLVPFAAFFRKRRILVILGFLFLYRFAEAQLGKLAQPFLLDAREVGGLALTTGEVGFVYGTVGIGMLTVGGLVGGFAAARHGLKRWLWWMALAINLPNTAYLYLAYFQPESFWAINAAVGVEQFGYGFGFTAYMLYSLYIAQGEHETVHYALCTGCMALGMMIPGMWSGWLEEIVGYRHFFVWVMLATLPSFLMVALIPLDEAFGRRKEPLVGEEPA
jgi:PAT family beta-lactamase induction signal transducer AmpG